MAELIGTAESLGVYPEALRDALSAIEAGRLGDAAGSVRRGYDSLDTVCLFLVRKARSADPQLTWKQVGHLLGISAQAAHERFASRVSA